MALFSSNIRRIALWGGVGIILIGGVVLMAYIATKPAVLPTQALVESHATHEWFTGPENAKVTLVEYSDFQCPACAAYYPLVKQLSQEYTSKIKVVYRYFPLRRIHRNADVAAYSAEAAGLQGKFWEMHDILFEKQTEWENSNSVSDLVFNYAKILSLNLERFKTDMNAQATKDKVEADLQSGIQSQVQGTPTFFLNGQQIQNPKSYEEFKTLINNALAQNS